MTPDFIRDDTWQRDVRDRVLAPYYYGKYCLNGRYVHVDKGRLAQTLQRRYAVDTFVQSKNGNDASIEEKIVRHHVPAYTAFCLETLSCTVPERRSPGWMIYGRADYLLYAFALTPDPVTALRVYLIDFAALQKWFWPRHHTFSQFGPLATLNRSAGRVVPIEHVEGAVRTRVCEISVADATSEAAE